MTQTEQIKTPAQLRATQANMTGYYHRMQRANFFAKKGVPAFHNRKQERAFYAKLRKRGMGFSRTGSSNRPGVRERLWSEARNQAYGSLDFIDDSAPDEDGVFKTLSEE